MTSGPPPGEFGLIRWIRDQTNPAPGVVLGIGDDCAILRPTPGAELVVTTDMLMEGRHFRLNEHGPHAVGVKAMGVNISDIAAMAARPVAAVVAVALPNSQGIAAAIAQGLHAGLAEMAERYHVALIGGDTNAWDGPLVVTVTLLGESVGRGCVRRSGARPGDLIYVTGPLGGSIHGRHLAPTPRVAEALALNEALPVHAMIDVSDGLAADLNHILEESGGLGAVLDADAVPIHPDAAGSLDRALSDGEDFELCFTIDPADAMRLPHRFPWHRIGEITTEPGLRLRRANGAVVPHTPRGFDHLGA